MIQGKTCKVCPLGTYQDKKWQTECKRCGDKMTTSKEGATKEDDCFCKCIFFVCRYVYFETQEAVRFLCSPYAYLANIIIVITVLVEPQDPQACT